MLPGEFVDIGQGWGLRPIFGSFHYRRCTGSQGDRNRHGSRQEQKGSLEQYGGAQRDDQRYRQWALDSRNLNIYHCNGDCGIVVEHAANLS
ncbi:hypothetical protein MTO96_044120 [Rhipicephalus appendiculatus]